MTTTSANNKTKFEEEYEKYEKSVSDTIADVQSNYKTIMTDPDINNKTKRFMAKLIQLIAYHNTMIKALYESGKSDKIMEKIAEIEKKVVEQCETQQKIYKNAENRLSKMYSNFITTNPNTVQAIQRAQASKFRSPTQPSRNTPRNVGNKKPVAQITTTTTTAEQE